MQLQIRLADERRVPGTQMNSKPKALKEFTWFFFLLREKETKKKEKKKKKNRAPCRRPENLQKMARPVARGIATSAAVSSAQRV
jgi:hypothetical protein